MYLAHQWVPPHPQGTRHLPQVQAGRPTDAAVQRRHRAHRLLLPPLSWQQYSAVNTPQRLRYSLHHVQAVDLRRSSQNCQMLRLGALLHCQHPTHEHAPRRDVGRASRSPQTCRLRCQGAVEVAAAGAACCPGCAAARSPVACWLRKHQLLQCLAMSHLHAAMAHLQLCRNSMCAVTSRMLIAGHSWRQESSCSEN